MSIKHVCGVCASEFGREEQYLDHECVSGYTPRDIENLGEQFQQISESAIERGNERLAGAIGKKKKTK